MLLDSQNLFSDNQPISLGVTDSTNIVKFGKGNISYLPLLIQVVEDFSNIDTLCVKILTSKTEAFENPVELAQSTLTLVDLKAGRKFPLVRMPKGNLGYVKLSYVATGSTTELTGKITAGVVAALDIEYEGDFYGADSDIITPIPSDSTPTDAPTENPTEEPLPDVNPDDDDELPDVDRSDGDSTGGGVSDTEVGID